MNTLLNRRTILMTAALGAGTTLLQACGGGDDEPQRNIVEIAQSNPDLSILVEAVVAAGLAPNLSTGSLTVFAPTDEAFAKIPKATLDGLLADKAALTKVLTYHVVPGKVMAKDVKAGKVKTVQGQELTVATSGGVMVDQSKVIATDVAASNGVIHAIDTVLMPK